VVAKRPEKENWKRDRVSQTFFGNADSKIENPKLKISTSRDGRRYQI
jgi:hypothetical protein